MATILSAQMSESAVENFAAFYEEWFERVYNYARHRTGSASRADEIASDTFTRAFKSWSRFDPAKGERRTWLFSIAFRAVADHYRAEKRGWLGLGLFPAPPRPDDRPARELEEAEERDRLLTALGRLEEREREIVSLRFFAGMSNREIAGLLELSDSNVGVILFRCIRRLRASMPAGEAGHG